ASTPQCSDPVARLRQPRGAASFSACPLFGGIVACPLFPGFGACPRNSVPETPGGGGDPGSVAGGVDFVEVVGGDEDVARLRALGGADDPLALEDIDQARGAREAHPHA